MPAKRSNVFKLYNATTHVQEISPGSFLRFYPDMTSIVEIDPDKLMHDLSKLPFTRREHHFFGRIPRREFYVADSHLTPYKYSNMNIQSVCWDDPCLPPDLVKLKKEISAWYSVDFNSVLMNEYENGHDSVSWHNDFSSSYALNCDCRIPIVSISLGATRDFHMRLIKENVYDTSNGKRKKVGDQTILQKDHKHTSFPGHFAIAMTHGSVLCMDGVTQKYWEHQIPKVTDDCGRRINLTFRKVLE